MADFTNITEVPLAPTAPVTADEGPSPVFYSYVEGTPASGGTPPVVTFVNPLPGTPISPTQPITVDITDVDGDLSLLLVSASLAEGLDEVIFRASTFTPGYGASTVVPIADGFRFSIRRLLGWTSELTLHADVSDATGNVA